METRVLEVHTNDSHDPAIQEAVRLLQEGEIVAIPTETVYGLAANALNADMVQKIFTAKGRPANNPVIVHVASAEHAKQLVVEWPAAAQKLTEAFWPGPLTIVLKKSDVVPGIVTAGGETVAIRCPNHPIALSIISACAFPLAAPSANLSNSISPTTAAHVAKSLSGRIPLVLDGGPCDAGIESTVVAIHENGVKILRPGAVSAEEISAVTGLEVITQEAVGSAANPQQSPGTLPVHYAPETPLHLLSKGQFNEMVEGGAGSNNQVGFMGFDVPESDKPNAVRMPDDAEAYARELYSVLHKLDEQGFNMIYCEVPPDEPEWLAIRDRLLRASSRTS